MARKPKPMPCPQCGAATMTCDMCGEKGVPILDIMDIFHYGRCTKCQNLTDEPCPAHGPDWPHPDRVEK